MSRRACLYSLLFLLLASALRADDYPNTDRGFAAEKAFMSGEIDNINTYNGNLVLTIPIGGTYSAGGSVGYGLTLVYNSNLWDFGERVDDFTGTVYRTSEPNRISNAGFGWLLSPGRLLSPTEPGNGNDTGHWVYLGPDGSEHVFYDKLHVGDEDEPGDGMFQFFSYTRDGSYLRMKALVGAVREVEFPNGQIHKFDGFGRLSQIRDRFNNALDITYGVQVWTLTDTTDGRTHKVHFQTLTQNNQPIEVVQRVELAAFGDANGTPSAIYTFNYAPETIVRGCPETDPQLGDVEVWFLTSITLPDGSSYQMPLSDYLTGLTQTDPLWRTSGAIKGLTLPTLGRREYEYGFYLLPNPSGKPFRDYSTGVIKRRTENASGTEIGTWEYVSSLTGPPGSRLLTTTVTNPPTGSDPLGHKTVHYFQTIGSHEFSLPFTSLTTDGAGRYLSTQTYNSTGTLLRSTYVLYESDQRPITNEHSELMNVNRREKSSRTVFHDDGGANAKYAEVTRSSFDGMGHYRTEVTGGNFSAGDARTTTVDFNHDRKTYQIDPVNNTPLPGHDFSQWPQDDDWVLETFGWRRSDEGGATEFSTFCFDVDTGFLRRQRTHMNVFGTAENVHDLLAVYTPDAAGNLQTEQYFGGDKQSITANGTTCSMGLPAAVYQINHTYQFGVRASSQYSNANFYSLNQTIDGSTGLTVQSRDVSEVKTDFDYDLMGRLTWVMPETGNFDGWTEYVYSRALSPSSLANVLIRRRNNGSQTAAVQAQGQIFVDARGRVWQEKQRLPSGSFNVRETLYDKAGHKASVSEVQTGTPTKKTQFLDYDPFGRAKTIRPADGASHDVTLTFFGTRVVERTVKIGTTTGAPESSATTTEVYDRQGRLSKVTEPSGESGAQVTTTYSYDVGNRLKQVQTQALVSGNQVTQNRFFNYDNRGFLLSETHPEKGISGNGTVTYTDYDARGHVGQKADGPNNLTFLYDKAERLTEVKETGGRSLKTFDYSGVNGNYTDPVTFSTCFNRRLGKLNKQSRYNYVTLSESEGEIEVELREEMTYCGRGGRLSRKSLENWVNDGLNEAFFLPNITYNTLGDVTSLSYPQCTHSACASAASSPRTVTSSYTNGFLTAVGTSTNAGYYATSIAYHPNLMVHQVVHNNNPSDASKRLTDTYANDPNAMRRPASIIVTTPTSATRWSSGTYTYDGAGNVKGIGTSSFTYDLVSRLKTADVKTASENLIFADGFETADMSCWDTGTCPESDLMRSQTYTFDAFGNIKAIGGDSARNTPTTSSTNRLSSASYDAAGNLTGWTAPNTTTYSYDPFNLMWKHHTDSGQWIYLYTADDERAWSYKTDNTSLWTLRGPGAEVLREYTTDGGWAVASDYIYRDGSLMAAETPQGIRHFHLDHLGTPRLISDSQGQQAAYHVYFPCGEEATDFNQDTIRTKFTGHERDLGSPEGAGDDLDYMHARHCSPVTGRFLSVDPLLALKPSTKRPQLWNRYAYVSGNPLKYFDPTGEVLQLTGDVNKALIDLKNTVPPEDRMFIRPKTTKTGEVILDERLLRSRARSSGSANFQRIAGIAGSSKTVQLNTSNASFTVSFRGSTRTIDFSAVPSLGGVTLPAGQLSATPNVTQIFIDPNRGALVTARALAEELVHASLFLQGKPSGHEVIRGVRDPRGAVNRLTAAAAEEAGKNYDPFQPLN